MRLEGILFLTIWALASAKSDEENNKKNVFSNLMESAMDGDNDSTFDSAQFCAKRFYTDKVLDPKFYKLKFSMATLGIMQCIVLVDVVLYPYNVIKQSVRDAKTLKKKGGSRGSLPSTILRSMALPPFKTFTRLAGVVFGAIMSYANFDQID